MTKKAQHFGDLDPARRIGAVLATILQLGLAAAAWTDLARRPGEAVRGRKALWAGVISVNFVGPLAYFCWGRLPR